MSPHSTRLTPLQESLYNHLLNSKEIRHAREGKQLDTLGAIRQLINICSHPKLLLDTYHAKKQCNEPVSEELVALVEIIQEYNSTHSNASASGGRGAAGSSSGSGSSGNSSSGNPGIGGDSLLNVLFLRFVRRSFLILAIASDLLLHHFKIKLNSLLGNNNTKAPTSGLTRLGMLNPQKAAEMRNFSLKKGFNPNAASSQDRLDPELSGM